MKCLYRIITCLFLLTGISRCFFDNKRITQTKRKLQTTNQSPEDPSLQYQSLKVPMSIYELSSPVDYATQNPGQQNGSPGIINISPMNHDSNYLKIADELKTYEAAYEACINHLSDNDFSDENVDACVGINYNYIYDDVDYEKSKLLARGDSAVRDFMIQNCYTVAGVDLVLSNACDLVEKDVINLLWNELNYASLLDYHRNKYMFEHSFMAEDIFNKILAELTIIQNETSSLLAELYDHRQLTLANLEKLISRRTSEILEKYHNKRGSNDYGVDGPTKIISIDVNQEDNCDQSLDIHENGKYLDYVPWQHGGHNTYRNLRGKSKRMRGVHGRASGRSLELSDGQVDDKPNKIEVKIEVKQEKLIENMAKGNNDNQGDDLLSVKGKISV